jgi:hypothetical protein
MNQQIEELLAAGYTANDLGLTHPAFMKAGYRTVFICDKGFNLSYPGTNVEACPQKHVRALAKDMIVKY